MAYQGVDWQNKPNQTSPINSANLEIMDNELVLLDSYKEKSEDSFNIIEDAFGINMIPYALSKTNEYVKNDHTIASSNSWNMYKFNASDISRISKLVTYCSNIGTPTIAFYGSDTVFTDATYIDGSWFSAVGESVLTDIDIPTNAVTILISTRVATNPNVTISGFFDGAYNTTIDGIKSDVSELQENTADVSNMRQAVITDLSIFNREELNAYISKTDYTFTDSNSWKMYLFDASKITKITKLITYCSAQYAPTIAFYSSDSVYSSLTYISSLEFSAVGKSVLTDIDIPANAVTIAICTRIATNTEFVCDGDVVDIIERVQEYVEKYMDAPYFGRIRTRGAQVPTFTKVIGSVDSVLSHLKMAMVKDGVVQYYLNQTDITKDIGNNFSSILNGTDGDLLVVNDVPIYYVSTGSSAYDMFLFALGEFEYAGVKARKIDTKGFAPGIGFVDNMNGAQGESHYSDLGNGQIHFVRNSENVAWFIPMHYMVGKYVPSQSGNNITYSYDSEKSFIDSGAYRPTHAFSLRTAEKAAMNKDSGGAVYTNRDLLTVEFILGMLYAEFGTRYVQNVNLLGSPFNSAMDSEVDSNLFENGTKAINGMRFKNSSNEWVYGSLNFNGLKTLEDENISVYTMLTDWLSPWEIMEQHLAVSYAVRNSIANNTWFVFNENEYKYRNVGENDILTGNAMSCILYKKFRSKLDGVKYDGSDISGNDIEWVIISDLYRGIVLDVAPHYWVTGLNVTLSDSNKYTFYAERNYRKYIMDKEYEEISPSDTYDFERVYQNAGEITNSSASTLRLKNHTDGTILCPEEIGASSSQYDSSTVVTWLVKASTGKKGVTGSKMGYGPSLTKEGFAYLALYHPRDYEVARGGGASFVCQNVVP